MPVIGTGGGSPYLRQYGATSAAALALPTGVEGVMGDPRPRATYATYRGVTYISGYFTRALMFTDYWGLFPVGVRAPMSGPTLAAGAGSGGSSGIAIGYITFAQKKGDRVIQESNPTTATAPVTVTGEGFSWTALPTVSVDPHATHICGYRSMDGEIPFLAWERELASATTTVTENVLTADLGRALPTRVGVDGEVEMDANARGVVPYCRFHAPYNDTMFWAGDPAHPDRVYPSKIFEPWAVNVSESDGTFLRTRKGETVVGLMEHESTGQLLVFCSPPAVYGITGYGPEDREMLPVPGGHYELLSHHSLAQVGPDAEVWGACQEGVVAFDGSFKNLMREREEDWRDRVRANPDLFARSWAVYDRSESGYKLFVPQEAAVTNRSFYFFGAYDPTTRGEQPYWTTDIRTREDGAAAEVRQYGRGFAEIHTASIDGYIRKENVEADGTDDSDTYDKTFDVTHAHLWLGPDGQAGDEQHGSSVTDLDLYTKNEDDDGTVYIYAGDDSAREAVAAQWSQTAQAGAEPAANRQKVALTSRHWANVGVGGKGISVRVRVANPVGVEHRGFSVYFHEGHQDRPFSE